MTPPSNPISDEAEEQAITRLVDGTVSPAERHALEQWARERPDVQRRIAEQRRVIGEFRRGEPEVPGALVEHVRQRVEQTYGTGSARRRARLGSSIGGWRPAISVAAVAVAVALVIVLTGGGANGPSVTRAARLAYAPATSPAPATKSATLLDVAYGGVTYPNYKHEFDAGPTGQLRNSIGGRPAFTVFYRLSNGARLSYTVFSGKPVPPPGPRGSWTTGA